MFYCHSFDSFFFGDCGWCWQYRWSSNVFMFACVLWRVVGVWQTKKHYHLHVSNVHINVRFWTLSLMDTWEMDMFHFKQLEGWPKSHWKYSLLFAAYFSIFFVHISALNPKVDTPLFATSANPLQLYHCPRVKIVAFKCLFIEVCCKKYIICWCMTHMEVTRW